MSFLSRFNKYKPVYIDLLVLFFPATSFVGFVTGLSASHGNRSIDIFTNIVGYTGIGMITGFTYPISYPLIGCYVLYKNNNIKN